MQEKGNRTEEPREDLPGPFREMLASTHRFLNLSRIKGEDAEPLLRSKKFIEGIAKGDLVVLSREEVKKLRAAAEKAEPEGPGGSAD